MFVLPLQAPVCRSPLPANFIHPHAEKPACTPPRSRAPARPAPARQSASPPQASCPLPPAQTPSSLAHSSRAAPSAAPAPSFAVCGICLPASCNLTQPRITRSREEGAVVRASDGTCAAAGLSDVHNHEHLCIMLLLIDLRRNGEQQQGMLGGVCSAGSPHTTATLHRPTAGAGSRLST